MNSSTPQKTGVKRALEDFITERPRKSPFGQLKADIGMFDEIKTFKFRILMPNGTTLELKISDKRTEIPMEEFLQVLEGEYFEVVKSGNLEKTKKNINWRNPDIHITDVNAKKMKIKVDLCKFSPSEWHILCLNDGSAEPETYEGMWDLTPDTDLLKELPDDYTFESALADLIDNSLQALWSNEGSDKKLISVELHQDKISIFDSGPGMDGTDGNLVKWGKMGASLHRSVRAQAVGGKPPYLKPFFGMFGYGGPVATMCLGRRAVVSSKTKNCKKVFTLHLEKEALLNASHLENSWKTKGGMRDPMEDEKKNAPHGSFTKVEIFEPKMKIHDVKHLQCKLKDIYFPYIQCDEMSGKTSRPMVFQVNGEDLAEIWDGEVATTNRHSCNGPNFTLQVHFSKRNDPSQAHDQSHRVLLEANASLKCVYFPIVEGQESIDKIISELKSAGCGNKESFESFSRVSVRRLGRLLPDTRWALLPFMEFKQKKGERSQMLKRCCSRVKCFIDADSGLNPTPNKADLAQHHPYTKVLKSFGNTGTENENEVQIEISRDGKKLTLSQLEKQYTDWIVQMHGHYDGETDVGLDEPTYLVHIQPSKIKKLDLSCDVVRVHKQIKRRGQDWFAGQKIKVIKGACSGFHKTNVFVTLEYILLEGLHGDTCGEGRLICRPLGLPENKSCLLVLENGRHTIDIRDSVVLPIRVIDSGKFVSVDETKWAAKLAAFSQKLPSAIELLSNINCKDLGIEGEDLRSVVEAGDAIPENIVAVIRPKAYESGKSSNSLEQKFIVRDKHEMSLEVKFRSFCENDDEDAHCFSMIRPPSSCKGVHGLYIFPVKSVPKIKIFEKAGSYTFSFSMNEVKGVRLKQVVQVQASTESGSWGVVSPNMDELLTIRVGSSFGPLKVEWLDRYGNHVLFTSVPKLITNLRSNSRVIAQISKMQAVLSTEKSFMEIKDGVAKSCMLDDIRPDYEATLDISAVDKAFSVALPCRVLPGTPYRISVRPEQCKKKKLIPGEIIHDLMLEVFDQYGNHAKKDDDILLLANGLSFKEGSCVIRNDGKSTKFLKKVNAEGFVDVRNILKVSKGYGKEVSLSVMSERSALLELHFQTETRKLQSVPKVFKDCEVGSTLKNVVFEVIDSEGNVDESIHNEEEHEQPHTLTIKSDSLDIDEHEFVRYNFRRGRCTIRSIPLPQTAGIFSFSAAHSRYPELNLTIEVNVIEAVRESCDFTANFEDVVGTPVQSLGDSCKNQRMPITSSPFSTDLRARHEDASSPPVSNEYFVSPIRRSRQKGAKSADPRARNKGFDVLPVRVSASEDMEKMAVHVIEAAHENHDVTVNFDDVVGTHVQSLGDSCKNQRMPFTSTPSLKDLRAGHEDASSNEYFVSPIRQNKELDLLPIREGKKEIMEELENDLTSCGLKVMELEGKLEMVNRTKSLIQQQIADLQARDLEYVSSMCTQEYVREQIKTKTQSAAAVVCKVLEEPFESRSSGVLGIVALLGTTESIELSRVFAKYLGEDLMLAVVCENYAAAFDLDTITGRELVTGEGQSIRLAYHALCLDDIRLAIPPILHSLGPPTLPTGDVPPGFRGYAIDMIRVETSRLQWRSKQGHELRDTLFYRLFGELQVYKDRECMMMAKSCIKDGAVSMDGSIIKGNGLISLGNWDPVIVFPVKNRAATPQISKTRRLLESLDSELMETNRQIDQFTEQYIKYKDMLGKYLDRYNSQCSSQNGSQSAPRSWPQR